MKLATSDAPLEASEVDDFMRMCPLQWALFKREIVAPVQPPAASFDSIKKLGKLLRGVRGPCN